jgi:ribosome-binding factor A
MGTFRGRGRRVASHREADASVEADRSFSLQDQHRKGRKLAQVCREVARTLTLALAGCDDEVLTGLTVGDVEPYPDLARLRVWLATAPVPAVTAEELLVHLERARGRLRDEVAAALERRRTPDFFFALASPLDLEEVQVPE